MHAALNRHAAVERGHEAFTIELADGVGQHPPEQRGDLRREDVAPLRVPARAAHGRREVLPGQQLRERVRARYGRRRSESTMQSRVALHALVEDAHRGVGVEHSVLRVYPWSSCQRRDRNRTADDHLQEW